MNSEACTLSKRRNLARGAGMWRGVVELDSRSKALFGVPETRPNTTYQDLLSLLHPDDRQLTEEAIKNVLAVKGDYDIIYRAIWPDQSVHWLRCKVTLARGFAKKCLA